MQTDRHIVIASQLAEKFNAAFEQATPNVTVISMPRGREPAPPPEAEIMFAAPFHRAGANDGYAPPPGWPFGLRWVQLASAGADLYPNWLFDVQVVTSARGVNSRALAEFALASILAAAKRFPDIWLDETKPWKPQRLSLAYGATLGLVGFGAISQMLAPMAQTIGLKVLAVRRSDTPLPPGVTRVKDLTDLFAASDHIVLACPATDETRHLVNDSLLAHAKPGLHLINIARGSVIDDDALLRALDDGRVGLASLDCTEPEPLPVEHPFYRHKRVRLSAHTSTYTEDAQENLIAKLAENLRRYRAGLPLQDIVDPSRRY
ncbi:MAG: glyoxylate reductase (NADP(+)) [Hyphomonadaceae bacterium]|nr:glyoxylate reductase (NADP(+)) [Hyphomonadaceae bacterium]